MMAVNTLCDLIETAAARGDRPAIIAFRDDGRQDVSFRELADRIRRLAYNLTRQGLRRGEPVLLIGPNCPEWIISYFGILRAGGMPAPLDAQSGPPEIARAALDCGARRAFAAPGHAGTLQAAITASPLQITVWDAIGGNNHATEPAPLPQLPPDDVASLLYTSGTTGAPKAVPLTHKNLLSNVEALAAAALAGPDDRVLLPLPLHHAYPFTAGLLGCLVTGATLIFPAGVSGPQLVKAMREAQATVLIGVPRLYLALFDGIEARVHARGYFAQAIFLLLLTISIAIRRRTGRRIGRFIFTPLHREIAPWLRLLASGGAKLDDALAWKLEGLGWEVLCGYGLTETSPIVSFNPRGRARLGSAGLALPGAEIRIAAGPGEEAGEIQVRGPNVFAGYRNNAQATSASFTADGWFRTGDLGWMDRDGYLYVTARTKEIIVLADGKKIVPEELEAIYAANPFIREVGIFESAGRLVALLTPDEESVLQHGAARIESLLRDAIEDVSLRLPPYRRLTEYRVTRSPLPRTHLGKIRRFLLPELYARAGSAAQAGAVAELTPEDRQLLAVAPISRIWDWLGSRFTGRPLSLDTSPQLDLHIDSLEWVALTLELQDRFGIALTQDALGRIVTVRDLLKEAAMAIRAGAPAGHDAAHIRPAGPQWLEPPGNMLRALGWFLYALNRLLIRGLFRLRVAGLNGLPGEGPLLVAANHASYLDGLVIAAALPWRMLHRVYWAGWAGFMFAGAVRGLLSRSVQVFPVDPDRDPAGGVALAVAALKRGAVLVWFPEGRRSPDGTIRPFMAGIGGLLQQSGAKVAPCLIQGSFEALPPHRRLPRFRRIDVTFGAPQNAAELEQAGSGESPAARIASGLRLAILALGDQTPPPAHRSDA